MQLGYMQQNTVYRFAVVEIMSVIDSGGRSDVHSLVTVQLRNIARERTIVNIRMTLSLAYIIPEADRCWLVNGRIDLSTFNEIH